MLNIIWKTSIFLFTVITGLASYFSWLEITPDSVKDNTLKYFVQLLNNFSFYSMYSFLFLFLLLIIYFLRKVKILSTNSCKRIGLIILFKSFNPINSFKLILELHKLEHLLLEKKKILKANGLFQDENEVFFDENKNFHLRDEVKDILEKFQTIFNIFSRDVSVNFKRLKREDLLETYKRIPSKLEKIKENDKEFYSFIPRTYNEIFKVSNNCVIQQMEKLSKEEENKDYSFNSAYDYVLSPNKDKYWICNNLKKSLAKKTFFSSSKDYEKYYNSLAIFNVSEKYDQSDEKIKDNSRTMGLLIFDGRTKAFNPKIAKELGGYLAHRLHSFLFEENIHLSIHESYKNHVESKKENTNKKPQILKSDFEKGKVSIGRKKLTTSDKSI
ncbi:hypothetical protein NG764_08865 [Aliarcobacter cryaerophilus]|uniref:hypothetical protein n=1 Tax=Aliarcobacter cryaerophilus TaxID=28198 RepID=UPI003DA383CD